MKKIVFIGDSITDANHNYSADCLGEGYVKMIADALENVEIINKGHDGFTVWSLWKFLDHDCISKQPDIVSILIGCNDVSIKMCTGKTLEEQDFEKTYEKILKKIRQKTNARIICMGPFIFPYPQEFINWIPDIKKAEEMARQAAEKQGALFLPLHDELLDESYTSDGTHLSEKGASVVAEKWLQATRNWLDKNVEIG